jgi:hypothetical protein
VAGGSDSWLADDLVFHYFGRHVTPRSLHHAVSTLGFGKGMPMSKLIHRRFMILLTAMLLLVGAYPMLHETKVWAEIYNVLRSLAFLAALPFVVSPRRQPVLALAIAAVVVAATWVAYALPGHKNFWAMVAFHVLGSAFFAAAIGSILWIIYRQHAVTFDSVAGAICAYLLIGAMFGHFYWLAQTLAPGLFRGEGEFAADLADPERSVFALTYYSMVTLASIGANDIVPSRSAAHGLTMVEAIFGQFYIAVLIADLIGKRIGQLQVQPPPSP